MIFKAGAGAEHGFAAEYAQMGEPELMKLANAYDSLVGPAQDALRAEFARRGMKPPVIEEPVEATSERLVTVRRYRDLSEAIVGRGMLESAGIFCFLRDENLVRMDWYLSNSIGGLRLQVRPEDEVVAEELLNQPVPESIAFNGQAEFAQPNCPRCGSINITFEGKNRSATVASMILVGLPLPQGAETWRCETCGSRWADDGDAPEES